MKRREEERGGREEKRGRERESERAREEPKCGRLGGGERKR